MIDQIEFLAVVEIWGVNLWVENLLLSLCISNKLNILEAVDGGPAEGLDRLSAGFGIASSGQLWASGR